MNIYTQFFAYLNLFLYTSLVYRRVLIEVEVLERGILSEKLHEEVQRSLGEEVLRQVQALQRLVCC